MYTANWNGQEVARSKKTIELEGAIYFPPNAVNVSFLRDSNEKSYCEWKKASPNYFDLVVEDSVNKAAVWRYSNLSSTLKAIDGWYSFWKGVEVNFVDSHDHDHLKLDHETPNVAKALGSQLVVWRIAPPFWKGATHFSGYCIPDLNIVVDVLSDPGVEGRPEVIKEAYERVQWSNEYSDNQKLKGKERYKYIAVWGSSHPSDEAIQNLKQGLSYVDLDKEDGDM